MGPSWLIETLIIEMSIDWNETAKPTSNQKQIKNKTKIDNYFNRAIIIESVFYWMKQIAGQL